MVLRTLSRWIDHVVDTGPLRSIFQNPRKTLHGYIEPGMKVLDIGCGTGFFSLEMAKLVRPNGKAICVDVQSGAIKNLKLRAFKAGLSGLIDARICDENNLEIDDLSGRIDFALAFYIVHHCADIAGLFYQVFRSLKSGGMFLIVEPGHHATGDYCTDIESKARQAGFSPVDYPKITRTWAICMKKDKAH